MPLYVEKSPVPVMGPAENAPLRMTGTAGKPPMRARDWRRLWLAAVPDLARCRTDCAAADFRLSLTAGPGDNTTVAATLEATATSFSGPGTGSKVTSGGAGSETGGGAGLPRQRLDRDTVFYLTRSQSLGLWTEVSRPINSGLRA